MGGWSTGATRRNIAFLRSIDERTLTGYGLAVTLTVRQCPDTPDEWHRLRDRWLTSVRRRFQVLRFHWVTEWQRRGVPHLHVALWVPDQVFAESQPFELRDALLAEWVRLASPTTGAGIGGQFATPITGAMGWFQYVAKHAARGVQHYQRSPEGIPEHWRSKTGRVWGRGGEWVTVEAVRVTLDDTPEGDGGWYAFRRLVRSWRVADARATGDAWRIRSARQMLKHGRGRSVGEKVAVSRVRGVSEWMTRAETFGIMDWLAAAGYRVRVIEE